MSRPRGFVEQWRPRAGTLELIEDVRAVLAEYRAMLPLTVRQVFYRLVAQRGFEKTERGYSRLCEVLNRARRARFIDMAAIRDDGFSLTRIDAFTDMADVLDTYRHHAATVELDRQRGQPSRLVVWCEAQGMVPMLERVTVRYGVPVASSGGFDSLTAKHDMAARIARAEHTTVLHLGDYDPSGVHMYSSLAEDVSAFARAAGARVSFHRLAVTAEQRDRYSLPTAPPKRTDRRAFADTSTVQCEALPPDLLLQLVEQAITERMDRAAYGAVLEDERRVQGELLAALEGIE
jgi:hypothetical protein